MNRTVIKKLITAVLAMCLLFTAAACGRTPEPVQTLPPTAPVQTTAPVETTEPATVPAETEPTEERFTLTFVGDCTLGVMPAHEYSYGGFTYIVGDDYEYPFRNVREYFDNDDFTMINFEGTLGYEGYAANKAFTFRGPAEYTNILTSSSVDAVTLANNHSLDYGQAGYAETKRLLDLAHVPYVEKDSSTLVTTPSGLTIGLYAAAFVIDQKDLEAEVAALREQGAEVVVFAIHWGSEGIYHSFVDQWNAAYKAIDAGVDIVYGHHPHVLQKMEQYNGGYIFYSLGNFSFGGNQSPVDMDTALIQLEVIRDPEGKVSLGELTIVPCCISSVSGSNNYQPTPYREGSDGYERVMQKLNGTWTGRNVVPDYNTADDITNPSTPTTPTVPTDPVTPPSGGEGSGESGGEGGNGDQEIPVPTPNPGTGGESGGAAGGETGGATGGETGGATGGETGDTAGGEGGDASGGESGGTAGDGPETPAPNPTPDPVPDPGSGGGEE